jgi:hypothetical protein
MKIKRISSILEDITQNQRKNLPEPPIVPGNTNASFEDTMKYLKKQKEIIVDWKTERAIETAIEKNCKEIPWEGTDVDKAGIKEDFIRILKEFTRTYK